MTEQVQIYIDGGNFYHLVLKKLRVQEPDFDFDRFANFLAGDRHFNREAKRYYTGTVREQLNDPRSKTAMALQNKLFTILKKADWEIKTSKPRRRMEEITIDTRTVNHEQLLRLGIKKIEYERWREKGIDVKIATDLIAGAVDNKYDTVIVVSSDADLVPAIDWVRNRYHKKVEYVGFSLPNPLDPDKSTKPLLSMISKTDLQRVITEEEIKQYLVGTAPLFNNCA
jgi:uncharacterized LabA/DUF88 family protein